MKTEMTLGHAVTHACARTYQKMAALVKQSRNAITAQFRDLADEHQHALRLLLNEAEALAWQTEFPHLIFPDLAEEKARGFSHWLAHQRAVRPEISK